jgi:hypothetical protein
MGREAVSGTWDLGLADGHLPRRAGDVAEALCDLLGDSARGVLPKLDVQWPGRDSAMTV